MHREVALLHHRARPCGIDELGLGQHVAIGAGQRRQQQDGPLADADWLAVAQQRASVCVQGKRAKHEALFEHRQILEVLGFGIFR
jgi:hypothetical protein